VEEVQAIVRIANEHRLPLGPIGRGKNNGYGGAAPQLRGVLMLDFRNMKQVLEINEELGYAIVEPGVSWFDLHDAIKAGTIDMRPQFSNTLIMASMMATRAEWRDGAGSMPERDHRKRSPGKWVSAAG
jgi:FAD/FMN-containing dehydrogenase